MIDPTSIAGLTQAVHRYFDLMYDADPAQFDRVFRATAQLHGFSRGELKVLTAQAYRNYLLGQPSPKSLGAPREEAILLVDLASVDQAMVKVRVRSDAIVYVDYLSYHHVDGEWRVTAKAYHVEQRHPPAPRP